MKINMSTIVFVRLSLLLCFLNLFGCDRERSNPVDPLSTVSSGKPEVPQGLRAQAAVSKILLSWQAVQDPDLAGYAIYRSTESNGNYAFLGGDGDTKLEITTGKLNFTDSLNTAGKSYFYRVAAVDTSGLRSDHSEFVGATVMEDRLSPGVPSNISVVADAQIPGRLVVRWRQPTADENGGVLTGLQGYVIFRSADGNGFEPIDSLGANIGRFEDVNLRPLTTYSYTLIAYDSNGNESDFSVPKSVQTIGLSIPPNLSAKSNSDAIEIEWSPIQDRKLLGYIVYRSERADADYEPLPSVEGSNFTTGHTTYIDSNLQTGDNYFYKVQAVGEGGILSELSTFVGARILPDQVSPAPPQNLSAIPSEEFFDRITLRWNAPVFDSNGDDLSGLEKFVLFRSRGGNSSFVPVDTLDSDERGYIDEGLESLTTYSYTVSALDGAGNESARSSVVQVRTEGPDQVSPAPPQNLSAIADKNDFGRITVTWNLPTEDVAGELLEDLAHIVLFRSESGSDGFVVVDTLNASQQTYIDTGLKVSTQYFYSLSAVDEYGNESPRGLSVRVNTEGPDLVAPKAPTNLFVVLNEEDFGLATLNWNQPRMDENGQVLADLAGFIVFRSKDEVSSYRKVAVVNAQILEYQDSQLDAFTTYYYQVSAFDDAGNESLRSTAFKVATSGADRVAPDIPGNLSVFQSQVSLGQVDLRWNAPKVDKLGEILDDLSQYIIFRSSSPNNSFYAIDSVGADVEFYVDSGLVPLKDYFYTITAVDLAGNESDRAPIVSVKAPGLDVVAPSKPTGLYAESNSENREITLTWNSPRFDSDGGDLTGLENYVIFRTSGNSSEFSVVRTLSSDVSRFVDNEGLSGATTYQYKIQALDQEGNRSSFSDIVSATTAGIEMPSGISANAGIGQILVSWIPSLGDNLLGYNVYRTERTDTEFVRLSGVEGTSFTTGKSTYVDSNLAAGSTYFYRISVVTNRGESDLSAFASATAQVDNRPPATPSFLEGESVIGDPEKLILSWAAPTTDYDGSALTGVALYNIYRAELANGPFEKVASAISSTYQDTGLTSVTTYYYRVTAVDNFGNTSVASTSVGVTTSGVARPTDVQISASTPSALADPPEVTLSWDQSPGAILFYEIERTQVENSRSDDDYVGVGDNTLNTVFIDNTVSRGNTYYYRLRARDVDDRVSEWTEIVRVEVKN